MAGINSEQSGMNVRGGNERPFLRHLYIYFYFYQSLRSSLAAIMSSKRVCTQEAPNRSLCSWTEKAAFGQHPLRMLTLGGQEAPGLLTPPTSGFHSNLILWVRRSNLHADTCVLITPGSWYGRLIGLDMYYGLGVCVPWRSVCWNLNPQFDDVWRLGFGKVLKSRE